MPERVSSIILAAAMALAATLGAGSSTPAETGAPQIAQDSPPRYQPPVRGAPRGRVSGASRGPAMDIGRIDVLAPDHVGRTSQEQPTLYWFNTQQVRLRVQLTITEADGEKPLLEIDLPQPARSGINSFALATTPVRLQTGAEYEWSVAIIANAAERSNDVVAGGLIQRVAATDPARGAAGVNPAQAARVYAEAGLWYDAIDALSRAIANSPSDAALRRDRAALLDQVGLTEAAALDRHAAR